MRYLLILLPFITGCITPQKASDKCNEWANRWPRYFNQDTVIKVVSPGYKEAREFKATKDTNVIRWGNSSFIYNLSEDTPPECDTVTINSIYRTPPDTVTRTVQQIKYKERAPDKKGKPYKWPFIITLLASLLIFYFLARRK